MDEDLAPLLRHISAATALPPERARRLVADVLAYYGETLEAFVNRRHAELTRQGVRNADAYERIRAEIAERPFAVAPPSTRQIRRLIYG